MKSIILFSLLFSLTNLCCADDMSFAIINFEAKGIDQSGADIISEEFRTQFKNRCRFKVLERSKIDLILKEQQLSQIGLSNETDLTKIGKLLGVNRIITGSAGVIGDLFYISVRVFDVETGLILTQKSVNYKNQMDVVLNVGVPFVTMQIIQAIFAEKK